MDSENTGIPATMLVSPTGIGNGNVAYPYPVFGGMGGGSGSGMGFGNDGGWIVLLLIIILVAAGGWGNNGNGGGAFGGQPIIVNDGGGSVQRGFDQAAVMSGINALTSNVCNGFSNVQQSLCNGFAGVNATVNSGVNTLAQQMYANQIADMQNSFALQSQFANCCCENRLGIANLGADIAREACADRAAVADGIRDVITNQTLGVQRILDQLCSDKIDAKNEKIADLERQLTAANLAASQIAQTAQIQRGQVAEVDALYQRLRDCPVPTMPVYGSQPIFTCPNNNSGCGCGTGGFNGNF